MYQYQFRGSQIFTRTQETLGPAFERHIGQRGGCFTAAVGLKAELQRLVPAQIRKPMAGNQIWLRHNLWSIWQPLPPTEQGKNRRGAINRNTCAQAILLTVDLLTECVLSIHNRELATLPVDAQPEGDTLSLDNTGVAALGHPGRHMTDTRIPFLHVIDDMELAAEQVVGDFQR